MLVKNAINNSSHMKIRFTAYQILRSMNANQQGIDSKQNSDVIFPILFAGLNEEEP